MSEILHNSVLPRKKTGLWTPWGAQKMPNLDPALDRPLRAWSASGDDRAGLVDGAEAERPLI